MVLRVFNAQRVGRIMVVLYETREQEASTMLLRSRKERDEGCGGFRCGVRLTGKISFHELFEGA